MVENFKQHNNKQGTRSWKAKENEALNLEKFVQRAAPVMENVIDENDQLYFLNNRELA